MLTEIHIWSKIGHTPITGRAGAYCDVLLKENVDLANPKEAAAYVRAKLQTVPHADKGHFIIPEWPNQNVRSGWFTKSSIPAPRDDENPYRRTSPDGTSFIGEAY